MNEKDNVLSGNTVKLLGGLVLFFFMIVFILATPNKTDEDDKGNGEVSSEDILLLFNQIENKYSLTITESIDNVTKKLTFITNSNINLYEGDMLDNDGYLYYNDKLYYINEDEKKLTETNKKYDFINDPYYDIDLIKRVVNHCEFGYETDARSKCTIKLNDYFEEYNNKYNTEYKVEDEEKLDFDIVHYPTKIEKIIIDYSRINKIINNKDESISYGIRFDDYDDETINEIFNNYKQELNN